MYRFNEPRRLTLELHAFGPDRRYGFLAGGFGGTTAGFEITLVDFGATTAVVEAACAGCFILGGLVNAMHGVAAVATSKTDAAPTT